MIWRVNVHHLSRGEEALNMILCREGPSIVGTQEIKDSIPSQEGDVLGG